MQEKAQRLVGLYCGPFHLSPNQANSTLVSTPVSCGLKGNYACPDLPKTSQNQDTALLEGVFGSIRRHVPCDATFQNFRSFHGELLQLQPLKPGALAEQFGGFDGRLRASRQAILSAHGRASNLPNHPSIEVRVHLAKLHCVDTALLAWMILAGQCAGYAGCEGVVCRLSIRCFLLANPFFRLGTETRAPAQ